VGWTRAIGSEESHTIRIVPGAEGGFMQAVTSTTEGTHTITVTTEELYALQETIALYLQDRDIKVSVRDPEHETPFEVQLKNLHEQIVEIIS